MDGDKLPLLPPPSGAANSPRTGSGGTAVPALPALPGVGPPQSSDALFSAPPPLLPARGDSASLAAPPEELFAGLLEVMATPAGDKTRRSGQWSPPPGASRVGSFVRNQRLCIHLRGCSKCRDESTLADRRQSVSRSRDKSKKRTGTGRGGRRKGKSGSRSGSARSKSPGRKCSTLCVHPSTKGIRDSSGKELLTGESPLFAARRRRVERQKEEEFLPLPQHGSEIELPIILKRLTVYHKIDFTQLTWEDLMALLTTNFRQSADLSEQQIEELEKMKEQILEKIEAGQIKRKDPRLKWKNRKMLLTVQLDHLNRARDIYQAVSETLSEHNAHMRLLPDLLQVRAFREVHSFNTDFLKSGCTLLRFTQVPGRLCRGINLYQACLALVIGRRWVIRVLQRRLKRISDRTQSANTAINSILQYKFQELPADRMRVSHLFAKLNEMMCWFEDVKSQMLATVQSLYDDLELRRQQQIDETVIATMDAEVNNDGEWKHLFDFNRCLAGLVQDMAARNALLRGMIDDTKSSARKRGRDDREWHTFLLRQGSGDGEGGQGACGRLNISRSRWLPV